MPTGPDRLRWMEAIVQVLARAGFGLQEQLDAALLIDGHVRTVAAMNHAIEATAQGARSYEPSTCCWATSKPTV